MKSRPLFKFPITALLLNLAAYALFTAVAMMNESTWDWRAVRNDQWAVRFLVIVFGCAAAGILRVAFYHPRLATKYGTWLSSTPWKFGQALPMGPVMLAWEDLLLLLPITLLAGWDALIPAWIPVVAYFAAYCFSAVWALHKFRVWFAYALLFLAGLPLLWHQQLWLLAAALTIAVVIAHVAISVSLKEFPWDLGDSMREFKRRPLIGLSWPFNRVGPWVANSPDPMVGFAAALLSGWWSYTLVHLVSEPLGIGPLLAEVMLRDVPGFCCALALLRAIRYCAPYLPPISLRGRIMTGRLIIPGYDYVLIAPITMALLGVLMPKLLILFLPPPQVVAITIAIVVAILFNGGPSMRRWQLTGHHRLYPFTVREPATPKRRAMQR